MKNREYQQYERAISDSEWLKQLEEESMARIRQEPIITNEERKDERDELARIEVREDLRISDEEKEQDLN